MLSALRRVAPALALAGLLALICVLKIGLAASTGTAHRACGRGSACAVALQVTAGYHGEYRQSAWVPVRVALRNRTTGIARGTVSIRDLGGGNVWSYPEYASLYQSTVVLPPLGSKQVSLYVPGQDFVNPIEVQYRSPGGGIVTTVAPPSSLDDATVSIGVLTDHLEAVAWLHHLRLGAGGSQLIPLSRDTLDPVAPALASFDAIVLSNTDTERLDRAQTAALEAYVRAGGSLLLVGGPDWQETLRSLPPALVPGTLTGSRVLAGLAVLGALGGQVSSRSSTDRGTTVSWLRRPHGTVLAEQAGVPLVVREPLGLGRVIYLGFDPAVDPVAHWSGARPMLTDVVMQAAAGAAGRLGPIQGQSPFVPGRFGPGTIRRELGNVPGAMSPSVYLLIGLALGSLLVIGPFNLLVLHWIGKLDLTWVTIPLLTATCFGSTVGITSHLTGNIALLNTIGVVQLDAGAGGQLHPAELYSDLFAPVSGTYRLIWNGSALPESLPPVDLAAGTPPASAQTGVLFAEGSQTQINFPSMGMWSTRSLALTTTVSIPGAIHADLRVLADGTIAGTVRNDTPLTLVGSILVAGTAVAHVPDLPPHTARFVRIQPSLDSFSFSTPLVWEQIYGPSPDGSLDGWDGDLWEEPPPPPEHTLNDRMRNAAERLPDAQTMLSLGEVVFAGWTTASLGNFTVNGVSPRRRDLTMVVTPLSVHFAPGTVQLLPGTLGPHLVDARLQPPQYGCCYTLSDDRQSVALGAGGSATFEFDLPVSRPVQVRRLLLSVDAAGVTEARVMQLYNWQSRRWVQVQMPLGAILLKHADSYVSPRGALQLRLLATKQSGDVVIGDPRRDLQLSGLLTVR